VYEWRDELISLFEDISDSVSLSRIFWKIFRNSEMSISQIIRQTGLNHKVVKKSLEKMINKGLVGEKSFGRMKIYFLNRDNPRIKILLTLLSMPSMSLFSENNRIKQFSQTRIT